MRRQSIRRADVVKVEQRPAIVQHEPGAGRDHPGAEIIEIALDQRHHVAVAVHGAEVDGLAAPLQIAWQVLQGLRGNSPSRHQICFARVAANSLESSSATGSLENFGSPM